jgi:hypothetical protein
MDDAYRAYRAKLDKILLDKDLLWPQEDVLMTAVLLLIAIVLVVGLFWIQQVPKPA